MNRFMLATAALTVLLVVPGNLEAEETESVMVRLETTDLPLSSFQSLLGIYVRSNAKRPAPDGYDTLFEVRPEGKTEGKAVRILHRGWTKDTVQLFYMPPSGEPLEIPRCPRNLNPYYLAFGAIQVEALPFVTLHFYFPPRNVERWKASPRKMLYVMPSECLAGHAVIDGRRIRVGLLDTNINARFGDSCRKHARDGDWILVDSNGDGRFSVTYSSSESRGITQRVILAGRTWAMKVVGETLILTPAPVETYKVRFSGLESPCAIFGWSKLTGSIKGSLDETGCIEVPRGEWIPYSYQWTKGDWRLSASLRSLGTQRAPFDGKTVEVRVGPKLKFDLKKSETVEGTKVTFRCLGKGGESVTLYRNGKRVDAPVLVISDPDGEEVFRKTMKYG
ncbi:MAG: hypothetical protein ACYTFG_15285 [Planctomycetota bacterium]|jgi:hypothetical protein